MLINMCLQTIPTPIWTDFFLSVFPVGPIVCYLSRIKVRILSDWKHGDNRRKHLFDRHYSASSDIFTNTGLQRIESEKSPHKTHTTPADKASQHLFWFCSLILNLLMEGRHWCQQTSTNSSNPGRVVVCLQECSIQTNFECVQIQKLSRWIQ